MRSVLAIFLLAIPVFAWADGSSKEAPVMVASCQCEVSTPGGDIKNLQEAIAEHAVIPGSLPGLSMVAPTHAGFAVGEYKLDMKGEVSRFHYGKMDKYCGYKADTEELNMACFYAMERAGQRATGNCASEAKKYYGAEAIGMIIPGTCVHQLEGVEKQAAVPNL